MGVGTIFLVLCAFRFLGEVGWIRVIGGSKLYRTGQLRMEGILVCCSCAFSCVSVLRYWYRKVLTACSTGLRMLLQTEPARFSCLGWFYLECGNSY